MKKKNEDNVIKNQLLKNNYPASFINKCYNLVNNSTEETKEKGESRYVKVPYIKGTSERLNRILKPVGITLAMKPTNKISARLRSVKDRINKNDRNCVVYRIGCNDCDSCYIGETGRQLGTRISEHKNNIRTLYDRSQLVQHMTTQNHTMDFGSVSILGTHEHDRSRKILEAFHTHTTRNTLNRALDIPPTYTNITNTVLSRDR